MNTHLDLKGIASAFSAAAARPARRLIICAGTGCVASGSLKVHKALVERIAAERLPVVTELHTEGPPSGASATDGQALPAAPTWISKSGCHGLCQMGPLMIVLPENFFFTKVSVGDVDEIVVTTLKNGRPVERLLYKDPTSGTPCANWADIPFYRLQKRVVLKECGHIDPDDIREYIAEGGYDAARTAYTRMTPESVCEEIEVSGLRGRGGGGFLTGRKWTLTRVQEEPKKYVICNGDEGDPGAFMDRSTMEGNPHSVIEGMMIAARGCGADEGYVYVRTEYPLAVKRIRRAVTEAERLGLLGDNLFGSGMSFRVHVMEGAGAFVCGEETALIASIKGKRGMPMPKPPFPAQKGLFDKPTVINNVETLATVPAIIRNGAAWLRSMGTKGSTGTKTFALTGHVANTGLIEVPFGITMREIVFHIGGGVIRDDGTPWPDGFKAVQIGGPSGGCLSTEHLDLPLDFDSLKEVGAMVGSGGLVVMNRSTCMVSVASFFMQFTQNESCGKCVPCREGTRQMLVLLDEITHGRATADTLATLQTLALAVGKSSLCGLGKTAANPVITALRHFRGEVEAHVFQKRCPTGRCKGLRTIAIDPVLCRGCTLCIRKCPVNAITGTVKKPHVIDPTLCTKCGVCAVACKFGAITGV